MSRIGGKEFPMLTFDGDDGPLLAYELASTGITYSENDNCILIAPDLRGCPSEGWDIVAEPSISDVVQLLRLGSGYVGVACSPVTNLIYQYWNGAVPEEMPAVYIADIIDLYIADAEWPPTLRYGDRLPVVREVHERAREIMLRGGIIPEEVVWRIKDAIGGLKDTVH